MAVFRSRSNIGDQGAALVREVMGRMDAQSDEPRWERASDGRLIGHLSDVRRVSISSVSGQMFESTAIDDAGPWREWQRVPCPPKLVRALVTRAEEGLAGQTTPLRHGARASTLSGSTVRSAR